MEHGTFLLVPIQYNLTFLIRRPPDDVRLCVQPDHPGLRQRGLLHRLLPLLLEGQQREKQRSDGARLQAAMSTNDKRIAGQDFFNLGKLLEAFT